VLLCGGEDLPVFFLFSKEEEMEWVVFNQLESESLLLWKVVPIVVSSSWSCRLRHRRQEEPTTTESRDGNKESAANHWKAIAGRRK
jgi:hypothetical protein